MKEIAEFVTNVTGLSDGEKLEVRLMGKDGTMSPYFFKGVSKALALCAKRRETHHAFFGVAPRKGTSSSGKKDDVSSLSSLWADLDRKGNTRLSTLKARLERFPFKPSYVVSTGAGVHAYWRLEKRHSTAPFEAAEAAMRDLQKVLRSDHTTDCSRILRMPGSLNHKYRPAREVKIVETHDVRYPLAWIRTMARAVDTHKLILGGSNKFKSRSERDFAVMAELVRSGANFALIEHVFANFPIGDRFAESGLEYLTRTFESVTGLVEASVDSEGETLEFVPFEDCYYVGESKVSTFVLEPKGIVERPGTDDAIVCDVHSRGYTWHHKVFPRSAFTRSDALQRHLSMVSWQWLGTDKQVRSLLVQLVDLLLVGKRVPKVQATHVVGRHGRSWLTPTSFINVNEGPELTYVNIGRESPQIDCTVQTDTEAYRKLLLELADYLPRLNRPEVIFPTLAWFLATPQKTVIERAGVRFPILTLFGTRGSGKTSLIELLQRLMGCAFPKGFDCDTTKFALLTLLGSTNGVPINLKEYREDTHSGKLVERMLRLAYDTGYDLRGRADQSTVTYPLTAPVVIDGEDLMSDPANLERSVAVGMAPLDILPDTDCHAAFTHLQHNVSLEDFFGRYIVFCLTQGDKFIKAMPSFVDRAQSIVRSTVLPARIVSNYAVMFYGLRVFQAFLESYEITFKVDTGIFVTSVGHVYEHSAGRTRLAIDDFVSDLINEIALSGGNRFIWRHDAEEGVLWFHLKTSYNWWKTVQRQRGNTSLGLTALKRQLGERTGGQEYVGKPRTKNVGRKTFWLYPIQTSVAAKTLDTPHPLAPGQIIISRSNTT